MLLLPLSALATPSERLGPTVVQTLTPDETVASYSFSESLDATGDLNADGIPDAIIGDYEQTGFAYIFHGEEDGTLTQALILEAEAGETDTLYGYQVVGAGDLNGDGFPDVAVPAAWSADLGTHSGSVYLYYGTATGLDPTEHRVFEEDGGAENSFGWGLESAGDINGDGFDDLISGSTYQHATSPGAAFLLYGSSSGIQSQLRIEPEDGVLDDDYGRIVSGVDDINGDGFDDLLVCSDSWKNEDGDAVGAVHIHYGAEDGVVDEERFIASDTADGDSFGFGLSRAGDVDGDGYADILIGVPGANTVAQSAGAFYIYYGSATGRQDREDKRYAPDGEYVDFMGVLVFDVGDPDQDGFADVGALSHDDDSAAGGGAAYLFYGAASGISWEYHKLTSPQPQSGEGFPQAAAPLGDLNGDGFGELLFGGGSNRAYLFTTGPEDADGDGVPYWLDCDDDDAHITEEVTFYTDTDADGYGTTSITSCDKTKGLAAQDGDCDDEDAAIHPGAAEVCGDGIDNNCDGWGLMSDDEDDDGLSSAEEAALKTEPCDPDTDGDGVSDGDEVAAGTDPLSAPDTQEPIDTDGDSDEDTGLPTPPSDPDCGCTSTSMGSGFLMGLLLLWRRRGDAKPVVL